jgi:uncharacterized protein (DUF433 family)
LDEKTKPYLLEDISVWKILPDLTSLIISLMLVANGMTEKEILTQYLTLKKEDIKAAQKRRYG